MGNLNLFKFFIHNELQSQRNKIWGKYGEISIPNISLLLFSEHHYL